MEQLRTEFQEPRTSLQQQLEDVTANLRDLGDEFRETIGAEGAKNVENKKELMMVPKEIESHYTNATEVDKHPVTVVSG